MKRFLLPATALIALACGPSSAPSQPDAGPAIDAPRYGGYINVRTQRDPYDWDVSYQGRSTPNGWGTALAYNTLIGLKMGPDIGYLDVVLQPELAERWEVSSDAKSFTFHLRKGVKYQDIPPLNGRELTAADVKWTFDYRTRGGEFKDKRLPQDTASSMFEGLDTVETPNPYTVVVRFKDPFIPFINYAASRWNPIIPKEIYDQDGHLKDRIVGTGPYYLDTASIQKGTRWNWKKNPNYWDTGKPYLDELRWIIAVEDGSANAAFIAKQLDTSDQHSYAPLQDILKAAPDAQVGKYYSTPTTIIMSQAKGGPLTDLRVRRAISLAVDRQAVDNLWGDGKSAWALPGSLAGMFTDTEVRALVKEDLNEAKRLMTEAGHAAGFELEWPVPRDLPTTDLSLWQLVQAQVKRIGINANLKVYERVEQRNKRGNGDYGMDMLGGASTGTLNADVDSYIYPKLHSTGSGNDSKIKDPELDRMLEASRRESDPAKRKELLRKLTLHVFDRMWEVALIFPPKYDVWQSHVRNYVPHFTEKPPYRESWIAR